MQQFIRILLSLFFGFMVSLTHASEEQGLLWLKQAVTAPNTVSGANQSVASLFQAQTETAYSLALLDQLPSDLNALKDDDQSTEALSRTLLIAQKANADTSSLQQQLLARQNADGGFGHLNGWQSNPLDTALALFVISPTETAVINSAITYLKANQRTDGGYLSTSKNPADLYTSIYVLNAFNLRVQQYPTLVSNAKLLVSFLESKQNSLSTWQTEDLFIQALINQALHNYRTTTVVETQFLQTALSQQQTNGSWDNDPYVTAVILRSLKTQMSAINNPVVSGVQLSVVDVETGLPLTTATLKYVAPNAVTPVSNNVDIHGHIELKNLASGTYQFTLSLSGYNETPFDVNLKQGEYLNLGTVKLSRAVNSTAAQITGKVTNAITGLPIDNVVVTIRGTNQTTLSNSNGQFQIAMASDGSIIVDVTKEGYAPIQVEGSVRAGSIFSFTPQLYPQSAYVTSVKGTVFDDSGTPLSNVSVVYQGAEISRTDSQGLFIINSIDAGQKTLDFVKDQYYKTSVHLSLTVNDPVVINKLVMQSVSTGSDTNTMTGNIFVKVIDSYYGYNISNPVITAELLDANDNVIQYQSFSITDTGVAAMKLSVGRWRVSASHISYENTYSKIVTLSQGDAIDLNAKLTHKSYTLSGALVDSETNEEILGAEVYVYDEIGQLPLGYNQILRGTGKFSSVFPSSKAYIKISHPLYISTIRFFDKTVTDTSDVGQIRLRKKSSSFVNLADLEILSVDRTDVISNQQSLYTSGQLKVRVQNNSNTDITTPVHAKAFIDLNHNLIYDDNEPVLGVAILANSLLMHQQTEVLIAIAGTLAFRDAPIGVWIDSDRQIAEKNEINNISFTGIADKKPNIVGTLDTIEKWYAEINPNNGFDGVEHPPLVAPVYDSTGDGVVNSLDNPSIIVTGYGRALYILDGKTGAIQKNIPIPTGEWSTPALADIDRDGKPEILTVDYYGAMLCFNPDGTLKWTSDRTGITYDSSTNIELADLDSDGNTEIVYGKHIFDNKGKMLFTLENASGAGFPVIADVDLDGIPEILADGVIYDNKGHIKKVTEGHGNAAVARFRADSPYPQIVWVDPAKTPVIMTDYRGDTLWNSGVFAGGIPTIADMDGDGWPEIGTINDNFYIALKGDGSVLWQTPIDDLGGGTGSSVFDFDHDGKVEIVYADEYYFYIFDGATGNVLSKLPHSSGTRAEYPVVADVDNDGHADIVVAENRRNGRSNTIFDGIKVYSGRNNDWAATRNIWNQHTYHVTNINDDLTIPAHEINSWDAHNTYRLNTFLSANIAEIADPTASLLQINDRGVIAPSTFTVRIGNAGGKTIATGLAVSFYQGNPTNGGMLLGTVLTSKPLDAGFYEDVVFNYTGSLGNIGELFVVANDVGTTGQTAIQEYTRANNIASLPVTTGYQSLTLETRLDKARYNAADALNISALVNNLGSFSSQADVRFTVLDSVNQPIAVLSTIPVSVQPQGLVTTQNVWSAAGVRAGDYQLRTELVRDNQVVTQQLSAFTLVSDAATTGLIAATLSSDKKQYSSADSVTLTQQLRNTSTNEMANHVQAVIELARPDGTVLWTQSSSYEQMVPQILREQRYQVPLANTVAGDYIARITVTSDNAPSVTTQAVLTVLPTSVTGVGLTGTLRGLQSALLGQDINYTWSIKNQGNSTVSDMPVRLMVVDAKTELAVATMPLPAQTITQTASTQQDVMWHAYGLTNTPLVVLLQTQIGTDWLTLAQQTLQLSKPVVITSILLDKTSYDLNDPVTITNHFVNQSAVTVSGVTVVTTITSPTGQVVKTDTTTVAINAQGQLDKAVAYALSRAAAGQWIVNTVVQDAQGVELNRQQSNFTVLSSAVTGTGISGTAQAPAAVVKGQAVTLSWTVKNEGNIDLTAVPVRVQLVDAQQVVVATLTDTVSAVAINATAQGQSTWTANVAYGSVVTATEQIQVNGVWKSLASTTISVTKPAITTTISSDKTSYDLNDPVTITNHFVNQSAVTVSGVNVVTTITSPAGQVVKTDTATVDINAQGQLDQTVTYALSRAAAGQWTVNTVVQDAQGVEFNRQQSNFTVLSSAVTGTGISGTAQAPAAVVKDQVVTLSWTVKNEGNVDLTAVPVRIQLVDAQQAVLATLTDTVAVAINATAQGQSVWNANVAYGSVVTATEQIQVNGVWKSLASATITVTKPEITTTISSDKTSYDINDPVTITNHFVNQSAVNVSGMSVVTTITSPTGQVVKTDTSTVSINAQGQLDKTVTYALSRAAAGQWIVNTVIQDAQGVELNRQQSNFTVLSSAVTGTGISGTAQAPAAVVKDQVVTLSWTVKNEGNVDLTAVPVRIQLVDAQQAVLATLTDTVAVAINATAQGQSTWTANVAYGSVVTATEQIQVNGVWKSLASTTITVTKPAITTTISSDKTSYDINDPVTITNHFVNQSAVNVSGVTVVTTITSPTGQVVKTDTTTVAINAQGQLDKTVAYALSRAAAGQWTVNTVVQDAQGVELNRQQSNFTVLSSAVTGTGISATLVATPVEVKVGDSVVLALSVKNLGNADLTNQAITLTIVRNQEVTPAQVLTTTISTLAQNGTIDKALSWIVAGKAGDTFTVTASTVFNGKTKVLASSAFIAKASAVVAVELKQEIATQSRVLVYYNCGHDWYKDMKGWSFGDDHYACFSSRAATLKGYLDSLAVNYTVVTKDKDFIKAFRSGRYNSTWLLGAIEKLPKDFNEELHEAINRGDALLLDGGVETWYNHDIYDIAGVQYRGRLNFSNSQLTPTLPVFTNTTAIGKPHSAGWPLYLKTTTGTVTATYGATQCQSVKKDWDHEKEHDEDREFYGRHDSTYPAIVSNVYGKGKAMSMAFDLISSLEQPKEKASWLALLQQSLTWSVPVVTTRTNYVAHEFVTLRSTLTNASTTAQSTKLQVKLPVGAVWMGAGTVATDRTVTQTITVPANGTQQVWLPLLLPTLAGTHTVTLSVLTSDGVLVGTAQEQRFTVQSADQRLAQVRITFEQLSLNKADDKHRDDAVRDMADAQNAWSRGRYDDALDDLGDAAEEIRQIASRDVSVERLALDDVIKAISIQWFDTQR